MGIAAGSAEAREVGARATLDPGRACPVIRDGCLLAAWLGGSSAGADNSDIAAGSAGAREVGARATLDPPRRLRHVRVDFVKAVEACFPKSWRREMRHGRFGVPVLSGTWTSSASTAAEKKRL